ncbi:uncharacterized protein LTR77_008948 [Saxophila tyrrhenica]|uniref:Uncharacterized protein n=1 Tax=Saxophila tyrrhenica TaxID=1690608 RepID=A0AAV9P2W8_9PEZI|nr:hypothetical protein LTR77_008948 [Saxophila tyrrhenica]
MPDEAFDEKVQALPPKIFDVIVNVTFTVGTSKMVLKSNANGRVKIASIQGCKPQLHLSLVDRASSHQYRTHFFRKTTIGFNNARDVSKWVESLKPGTRALVESVKLSRPDLEVGRRIFAREVFIWQLDLLGDGGTVEYRFGRDEEGVVVLF